MASQRGAGTVMVAAIMAVVMLVAGAGVLAGMAALTHRDAAQAADLAALSAAAAFVRGDDPCGAARRIAAANGGELVRCRLSGDALDFVVTVEIQRRVQLVLGLRPTVHAEAHAGRLEAGR